MQSFDIKKLHDNVKLHLTVQQQKTLRLSVVADFDGKGVEYTFGLQIVSEHGFDFGVYFRLVDFELAEHGLDMYDEVGNELVSRLRSAILARPLPLQRSTDKHPTSGAEKSVPAV